MSLTDYQIRSLRTLAAAGVPLPDIAQQLGVPVSRVSHAAHSLGVVLTTKRYKARMEKRAARDTDASKAERTLATAHALNDAKTALRREIALAKAEAHSAPPYRGSWE
jgi:hypothetical protein